MSQYRFWWDETNIEHIANHGVEPYEAKRKKLLTTTHLLQKWAKVNL